jgi:DNA polymerase-3 subunit alpha (Gram-positive type)
MYVVFDVETAGKTFDDQIIEIAGLQLDESLTIVDQYVSLIQYQDKLPKEIVELTGITDDLLQAEGRDIATVMDEFEEFADGCILVAHNAPFDLQHLRKYIKTTFPFYDTLFLARKLIPWIPSHALDKLTSELAIPLSGHHRALNDIFPLVELIRLFLPMMRARGQDWQNHVFVRENESITLPNAILVPLVRGKVERFYFDHAPSN